MTNKEIRKKAYATWRSNLGLIAFMGLVSAVFQAVLSVATAVAQADQLTSLLVSIVGMFITAPISICTANVLARLIHGHNIHKGYIFEWLGDMKLVWFSFKVNVCYTFKMIPAVFLVLVVAALAFLGMDSALSLGLPETFSLGLWVVTLITVLLVLIWMFIKYQGGIWECAQHPSTVVTPVFNFGCEKMKYNRKDYIKICLWYIPVIILFMGPSLAYDILVGKIDAIYYLTTAFMIVGEGFVITPLLTLSGILCNNRAVNIPKGAMLKHLGINFPPEPPQPENKETNEEDEFGGYC